MGDAHADNRNLVGVLRMWEPLLGTGVSGNFDIACIQFRNLC